MQQEPTTTYGIVGVDIGGTFTDIVYYTPAPPHAIEDEVQPTLHLYKVPSTPDDPVRGLLNALEALHAEQCSALIHGSTVATNALLERKGARAILITTAGFADVLEIARQDRPSLYALEQQRPAVLIPQERRLELAERLDHHGAVLQAPSAATFSALLERISAAAALSSGVPESIAISLLYSFRNPAHEQQLAALLKEHFPDTYLSLSSEILPQFREYERTSSVAVNAYVQPLMARYLHKLQSHLTAPLRIMQSSGGSISAATAAEQPVRTVLSGPAGGVLGAFHIASMAGFEQIMTLDMGGTSTDVALCPGSIPQTSEAVVAGCPVGIPAVAIHTVGAGGGSVVRLDAGHALTVGPDSVGAQPGPACYGDGDALAVTDANLVLGRIDPAHFLGGRFTLYPERAQQRMAVLAGEMGVSVSEAALGVIRVVNASMERALRTVSLEQGYDPRLFALLPFGGAGPLHACELAEALSVPQVFIPRYPGVLSALGMILAPIVKDYVQTVMLNINTGAAAVVTASAMLSVTQLESIFAPLQERAVQEMEHERQSLSSATHAQQELQRLYDLRYLGQSYELTVPAAADLAATVASFHALHLQRFGHSHPEQVVQLVAVRIKAILQPVQPELAKTPYHGPSAAHALLSETSMIFAAGTYQAGIYQRALLQHGNCLVGPALLVQDDSTILLPPFWSGTVDAWGNIVAQFSPPSSAATEASAHASVTAPTTAAIGDQEPVFDAVSLEIFKHLFASIADEMGVTLGRTAYSPNIKERKDYSCACFDAQGRLLAQAAHIPVHLGAMPASVQVVIEQFPVLDPGDLIILNDPYLGGTHLPDITMVTPVFIATDPDGHAGELFGFVASRAHHADIGGISPGSMPMSREIFQEGIIIPPVKLLKRGVLNEELLQLFYRNVRTPAERRGDMDAQMAAARVGERRLHAIIARYGSRSVQHHASALIDYSAHLTRLALAELPTNEVSFTDYLDDDGWDSGPLPISVHMQVRESVLYVDFRGTAPQSRGCVNAVQAVTHSCVLYAVRCLVGEYVPVNQGCLLPVRISIPSGSLLQPLAPAAVAAGNVETSQRTVDVLFGALALLAPHRIPAASQGTMNNLTLGGYNPETERIFAYYETMGGGMGARPASAGLSGVHVHMSNTRNTPIEVLEMDLPLRVQRYALRAGSGGAGRYRGGDGLCRAFTFLAPAQVTLLTDRRQRAPYGLSGGLSGATGLNILEHAGTRTVLPAKVALDVQSGDTLTIYTPGGGGFFQPLEASDHVD